MKVEHGALSVKITEDSSEAAAKATDEPPPHTIVVEHNSPVPDLSTTPGMCYAFSPTTVTNLASLMSAANTELTKIEPNRHERRKQASLAKKKKGKSA